MILDQRTQWMTPKEPVWLYKNANFIKAIIQNITQELVICMLEDGALVQTKKSLIFQRNPTSNAFDQDRFDLMDIDVLNEPEILKMLKQRLENKRIYTFVENSLIVVNPYMPIDLLYLDTLKKFYIQKIIKKKESIRDYEPHVYSIVGLMLSDLIEKKSNQAIIISGESGAGKTQTNKECLRFLKYFFHHENTSSKDTLKERIQKIIYLSNPILEAFGNSKTIRNLNSSRFGKYLNIEYSLLTGEIKTVKIYNYLLQKSRIISRGEKEQNFHIFYELLAHLPSYYKHEYFLMESSMNGKKQMGLNNFNYLNNGNSKKVVKYQAHSDIKFNQIQSAIQQIDQDTSQNNSFNFVCKILIAILYLGNLQPEETNQQKFIIQPQAQVSIICQLLEISKQLFVEALTIYTYKVGEGNIKKYFNYKEIKELINSLTKCLYQKLFTYLVNLLNQYGNNKQASQNYNKQWRSQNQIVCLGFLDIYGFELLEHNSLEQLFINYTNERIHQLFLTKIFKQERNQYIKQKLEHKYRAINYTDNQSVIQLIDYQNLSVLNLLNQFCTMNTDQSSFITKLRYNLKKNQRFSKHNFTLPTMMFAIKHTPKDIQYHVEGFRDKNKDLLRDQIKNTMNMSHNLKIRHIFQDENIHNTQNSTSIGAVNSSVVKSGAVNSSIVNSGAVNSSSIVNSTSHNGSKDPNANKIKRFLSSKFRKEMNTLINDILNQSDLHFIRCVKSNSQKRALFLDEEVVYNQICYLGVLDSIQIKKMGYCIKLSYQIISKRFQWLFRDQPFLNQIVKNIQTFMKRYCQAEDILFGKTKIFFKDYAYSNLVKKYNTFLLDLHLKVKRVQNRWFKLKYQKKKKNKLINSLLIKKYCFSIYPHIIYKTKLKNILMIQQVIRAGLHKMRITRRQRCLVLVQTYTKRLIALNNKTTKILSISKMAQIIKCFLIKQRQVKLKLCQTLVEKMLVERCWMKIVLRNKAIIERYLSGYMIQNNKKSQIALANVNSLNIMKIKNGNIIQKYLKGHLSNVAKQQILEKINYFQRFVKTWLDHRRYKNLQRSAIIIQRAYKQYYFNKKISKQIFQQNFHQYNNQLQNINKSIRQFLYKTNTLQSQNDTVEILYKNYLKFKEKFNLIYFIIDFQAFINLQYVYKSEGGWILQYFQGIRESLNRDQPIQGIQIGEKVTVMTTTNKCFAWGTSTHNNEKLAIDGKYVQIGKNNKSRIEKVYVERNNIQIQYEIFQKKEIFKIYSTTNRGFNLEQGKLYQCYADRLKLIKLPSLHERILEVACGNSHVILKSTSKKIYTFGCGKNGQLGHGTFSSQEHPKIIKLPELFKSYTALQISASYNSSIILFSNRKILWFGSNGTIDKINIPTALDLKLKTDLFSSPQFCPLKIQSSWSRSLSVIGIVFLCYNEKLANNIALRTKIADLITNKWQEADPQKINPPYCNAYSDYLDECHVKLPQNKIVIEPESKRILKEMESKVKSIHNDKIGEISFSDSNKADFFK